MILFFTGGNWGTERSAVIVNALDDTDYRSLDPAHTMAPQGVLPIAQLLIVAFLFVWKCLVHCDPTSWHCSIFGLLCPKAPWEYPKIPGHFPSNNALVGEIIFNKGSLNFCLGLIKASSARLPPHQYSTDLLKSRVSLGLIVCVVFFLNSSTGGKKNSPKRPKGAYFSLKLHCRHLVWCFE